MELDGAGGDQAADAVVVDDLQKLGVLQAVDGLKQFVVIHQDDLLTGIDVVDQLGDRDAQLAQHPAGLGRQLAQARRLVDAAGSVALRQDVLELRIADRSADRVVVGILMAYDDDGFRHVRSFPKPL